MPLLVARLRAQVYRAEPATRGELLRSHLAMLDRLLAAGASVDAVGSVFRKPGLHDALLGGCEDSVRELLARGADPEKRGPWGDSARELVAHYGLDAMAALLEVGR